jgi:hypothetical protein
VQFAVSSWPAQRRSSTVPRARTRSSARHTSTPSPRTRIRTPSSLSPTTRRPAARASRGTARSECSMTRTTARGRS